MNSGSFQPEMQCPSEHCTGFRDFWIAGEIVLHCAAMGDGQMANKIRTILPHD